MKSLKDLCLNAIYCNMPMALSKLPKTLRVEINLGCFDKIKRTYPMAHLVDMIPLNVKWDCLYKNMCENDGHADSGEIHQYGLKHNYIFRELNNGPVLWKGVSTDTGSENWPMHIRGEMTPFYSRDKELDGQTSEGFVLIRHGDSRMIVDVELYNCHDYKWAL